jgi:hypothetical protein
MATFNSTEYNNGVVFPATMNDTCDEHGRVRICAFNYTQVGAGTGGDFVNLCGLPGGNIRILLVAVTTSAFGASRTIKIGHTAFTTLANTTTALNSTAFLGSTSIASAGTTSAHLTANKYTSREGITVQALIEGGTLPDAATITGHILYAID